MTAQVPKRKDVRPVAVFYYDRSSEEHKKLLYLPYQYFPPKHRYWAVVAFYGSLDKARILGYLPITSLLTTLADGKYDSTKEPEITLVEKGKKIGPAESDLAWTSMDAIKASRLIPQVGADSRLSLLLRLRPIFNVCPRMKPLLCTGAAHHRP